MGWVSLDVLLERNGWVIQVIGSRYFKLVVNGVEAGVIIHWSQPIACLMEGFQPMATAGHFNHLNNLIGDTNLHLKLHGWFFPLTPGDTKLVWDASKKCPSFRSPILNPKRNRSFYPRTSTYPMKKFMVGSDDSWLLLSESWLPFPGVPFLHFQGACFVLARSKPLVAQVACNYSP